MDPSDRRRRAAAEAAEWWTTLQGDVSRGQREQYIDWLRESPLHVSELLRVAQVQGTLELFERWAKLPTDGHSDAADAVIQLPVQEARERTAFTIRPRKPARVRFVASLAAILLITVMVGTLLYTRLGGQTIQTERGERRAVALADGSLVQ